MKPNNKGADVVCRLCCACLQLSALVLTKLLQSCPDIRQQLRAGYLIGGTDYGGGSSTLAMNTKVARLACSTCIFASLLSMTRPVTPAICTRRVPRVGHLGE